MSVYKKIDTSDIQCLKDIVGDKDVIYGNEISEDYSHDELGGISNYPEVLVRVHQIYIFY
jgi:glycolate oxidase